MILQMWVYFILLVFFFKTCLSCLQAIILVFRGYSFQHTSSVPHWKYCENSFKNHRKNKGYFTRFGWHKALLDPTWLQERDFPHWIMQLWWWSCSFAQKFCPVSFPELVRSKTLISQGCLLTLFHIISFILAVHNTVRSIKCSANVL